jgi:hypothetical protein
MDEQLPTPTFCNPWFRLMIQQPLEAVPDYGDIPGYIQQCGERTEPMICGHCRARTGWWNPKSRSFECYICRSRLTEQGWAWLGGRSTYVPVISDPRSVAEPNVVTCGFCSHVTARRQDDGTHLCDFVDFDHPYPGCRARLELDGIWRIRSRFLTSEEQIYTCSCGQVIKCDEHGFQSMRISPDGSVSGWTNHVIWVVTEHLHWCHPKCRSLIHTLSDGLCLRCRRPLDLNTLQKIAFV